MPPSTRDLESEPVGSVPLVASKGVCSGNHRRCRSFGVQNQTSSTSLDRDSSRFTNEGDETLAPFECDGPVAKAPDRWERETREDPDEQEGDDEFEKCGTSPHGGKLRRRRGASMRD